MNDTYSDVFRLLRHSLLSKTGEPLERLNDWTAVFEEMKAQSVAALPYEWLKEQKNGDYTPWLNRCLRSQARWAKVMYGQSQLLTLLEKNQIDCVILKGAAAAMAYPHPQLRDMGDVDFLVKRCDRDRTARLLEENGYRLEQEKDENHHHYGYAKDGISFELHWRVGTFSSSNERFLSLFEEGIANRVIRTTGSFSFPTLPTDLNGLVLISHINQHLRSGLGLRQIVDWMMYVDQLPERIWDERLRPLLQETGMEKLALCVIVMCQRYLGLAKQPDGCEIIDVELCDELMDYIMEKGNFGKKSGETGKIASVYLAMSNPIRVLRRLQAGGMCRWSLAKKHAFLRPFAWIYQIGFIISELIRHRISPKEMTKQHTQGIAQRKLIEDLGLRVDRNIGTF